MQLLLDLLDAHPEIESFDALFFVLDAEREEFEFQCFLTFLADREAEEDGN